MFLKIAKKSEPVLVPITAIFKKKSFPVCVSVRCAPLYLTALLFTLLVLPVNRFNISAKIRLNNR